jgi:7,8-dihydro-6-hydroxymethylpterin dimethyltransferase
MTAVQPSNVSLREALQRYGLFTPHQTATRRWPIGCISLEVTQRCNLDCTLCYLSEHSEAVRDVPLEELFRRIDRIAERYGPNTDVQISGGDPTLRDHDELVEITAYIRSKGLRSSLFTNGILASRELLIRLRNAGLSDVAFHVDLTQERKGYATEADLHALRLQYIERARGLGLSIFFNTTIFDGNAYEVPMLAQFFAQHSDAVQLVSFQMQAATGRGTLGGRPDALTQQRMMQWIEQGAGSVLNWDALIGGHPSCNRYATALVLGNGAHTKAYDLFADGDFIARVMRETAHVPIMRGRPVRAALSWSQAVLSQPRLALAGLRWLLHLLWQVRRDALKLGSARKISFFIHNFMDAQHLERERIETCVFMAATADTGSQAFVPMCEYNARRDEFLLRPIALADGSLWQPVQALGDSPRSADMVRANAQGLALYPLKLLKGRSRQHAMQMRKAQRTTTHSHDAS